MVGKYRSDESAKLSGFKGRMGAWLRVFVGHRIARVLWVTWIYKILAWVNKCLLWT